MFQAIHKLWLMDLPGGKPRRLTPDSFTPGEEFPPGCGNGKSIPLSSWDDANHGQLWTVASSGGSPAPITKDPGEYLNPTWSSDGAMLAYSRGSGATLRGRDWARNEWYDIVVKPVKGGEPQTLVRLSAEEAPGTRAQFGPAGRIYYAEHRAEKGGSIFDGREVTDLVSVQKDGADRRVHATFLNTTMIQLLS